MKVKNIDWTELFNEHFGDISGLQIFTISYEDGYYKIDSNLLIDKLCIDEKYFEREFRKLENAKRYCEKILMKELFDLFFEDI